MAKASHSVEKASNENHRNEIVRIFARRAHNNPHVTSKRSKNVPLHPTFPNSPSEDRVPFRTLLFKSSSLHLRRWPNPLGSTIETSYLVGTAQKSVQRYKYGLRRVW